MTNHDTEVVQFREVTVADHLIGGDWILINNLAYVTVDRGGSTGSTVQLIRITDGAEHSIAPSVAVEYVPLAKTQLFM